MKDRSKMVKKDLRKLEISLGRQMETELEFLHEELQESMIKRFEFSLDTFWKLLKDYLSEELQINVDIPSPKKVFRACVENKIITDQEFNLLAKAVVDRNLTSHTYNEDLAEEISSRISQHYKVMSEIVKRLPV